jgi:hypothetical protein
LGGFPSEIKESVKTVASVEWTQAISKMKDEYCTWRDERIKALEDSARSAVGKDREELRRLDSWVKQNMPFLMDAHNTICERDSNIQGLEGKLLSANEKIQQQAALVLEINEKLRLSADLFNSKEELLNLRSEAFAANETRYAEDRNKWWEVQKAQSEVVIILGHNGIL